MVTEREALKLALEALERVMKHGQAVQEAKNILCAAISKPQSTWVGLTWDDLPETAVGDVGFMQGAKWAEAKLKEKNT